MEKKQTKNIDISVQEPEISTEEQTILLLQQIRDELARQNARNTQNVPNDSDTVAGAVAVR